MRGEPPYDLIALPPMTSDEEDPNYDPGAQFTCGVRGWDPACPHEGSMDRLRDAIHLRAPGARAELARRLAESE